MTKAYDIPYSNYPPGVDDDDPYFGEYESAPENEAQYQSRIYHAKEQLRELEHQLDCECEECVCPY